MGYTLLLLSLFTTMICLAILTPTPCSDIVDEWVCAVYLELSDSPHQDHNPNNTIYVKATVKCRVLKRLLSIRNEGKTDDSGLLTLDEFLEQMRDCRSLTLNPLSDTAEDTRLGSSKDDEAADDMDDLTGNTVLTYHRSDRTTNASEVYNSSMMMPSDAGHNSWSGYSSTAKSMDNLDFASEECCSLHSIKRLRNRKGERDSRKTPQKQNKSKSILWNFRQYKLSHKSCLMSREFTHWNSSCHNNVSYKPIRNNLVCNDGGGGVEKGYIKSFPCCGFRKRPELSLLISNEKYETRNHGCKNNFANLNNVEMNSSRKEKTKFSKGNHSVLFSFKRILSTLSSYRKTRTEEMSSFSNNFISFWIFTVCEVCCVSLCALVFLSHWIYLPKVTFRGSITKLSESILDLGTNGHENNYFNFTKPPRDKKLDLRSSWSSDESHYVTAAGKTWSNHDYAVYPVKSHLERVASFTGFHNRSSVPFLKFAQYGFYSTGGDGQLLECSDCSSRVKAESITSSPSDKKYHASVRCQFASTGDDADIGSSCENDSIAQAQVQIRSASPRRPCLAQAGSEIEAMTDTVTNSAEIETGGADAVFGGRYDGIPREDVTNQEGCGCEYKHDSLLSDSAELDQSDPGFQKDKNNLKCSPSSCSRASPQRREINGAPSTIKDEKPLPKWIDSTDFRYEAADVQSSANAQNLQLGEVSCDKEHDHTRLLSPKELTLKHVPIEMRSEDIYFCVKLLAALTVKVNVSTTSVWRPKEEDLPSQQTSKGGGDTPRCGTGLAFVLGADNARTWMKELDDKNELTPFQRKSWTSERKADSRSRNEGETAVYFTVVTSTHVVFDQHEAECSEIDLFYDSNDGDKVVSVPGVAVKHSSQPGEYKSYLICKTYDKDLMRRIYFSRQKLQDHIKTMSESAKRTLVNRCLVVFHPHGCEKKVSFGRCAVSKYGLTGTDNNNTSHDDRGRKTNYLPDKASVSRTKDVREVLLYTAATCPGSSGSPVFTAREFAKDSASGSKLELVLWIHNGVEKSTKLGGSIMRTVEPDDPYNSEEPVPMPTLSRRLREPLPLNATPSPSVTENQQPATTTTTTTPTPSTSTTTNSPPTPSNATSQSVPPLYPMFYSWEKRLSSFQDPSYNSKCQHSPAELAVAGFFYAKTTCDCVRCFYCGLGLKAWRSNDDVYQEHQKVRPNCGFLKLCLNWKGTLNLELLDNRECLPHSSGVPNVN